MRFTWDEAKRLANLAKHELDFADAALVYGNPNKVTLPVTRRGESRLVDIAMVEIQGYNPAACLCAEGRRSTGNFFPDSPTAKKGEPMKLSPESQTNWKEVKRRYDEEAPIPFDDDDRAEGLYNPNNGAEVEEFFRNATVIYPDGRTLILHPKKEVFLQLSEDVLAHYRAKGDDWQSEIDEALRRSMEMR